MEGGTGGWRHVVRLRDRWTADARDRRRGTHRHGVAMQHHSQHQEPAQGVAMLRVQRNRQLWKLDLRIESLGKGPKPLPIVFTVYPIQASGKPWPRRVGLQAVEEGLQ